MLWRKRYLCVPQIGLKSVKPHLTANESIYENLKCVSMFPKL